MRRAGCQFRPTAVRAGSPRLSSASVRWPWRCHCHSAGARAGAGALVDNAVDGRALTMGKQETPGKANDSSVVHARNSIHKSIL